MQSRTALQVEPVFLGFPWIRGNCRQVVIALIVTPEGFPLRYEMMGGGTADPTTLGGLLDRVEHRYGGANRIWVMDRGIPTDDSLAKMRSIGASYFVRTPKGRLTKLEQTFRNCMPIQMPQPSAKVLKASLKLGQFILQGSPLA